MVIECKAAGTETLSALQAAGEALDRVNELRTAESCLCWDHDPEIRPNIVKNHRFADIDQ